MIDVIYEDSHYVAVYKPAGLLVHRSPIDRHETDFALQRARDRIGKRVYPVHRLDKPTSGILLFALSSEAAHRAMLKFHAGEMNKRYLAVVRGHPPESGQIDYPLVQRLDPFAYAGPAKTRPGPVDGAAVGPAVDAAPRQVPRRAAKSSTRDIDTIGATAVTGYRRLAAAELPEPVGRYATARYALLELEPRHGRRHQLRRHMKHVFHPILGDTTYGDGRHNRFFRDHFSARRLMLTATALAFEHPYSGTKVTISAAPDAAFTRVCDALGWRLPDAPDVERSPAPASG